MESRYDGVRSLGVASSCCSVKVCRHGGDDDNRGRGIGDAAWLVAGATELIKAFSESDGWPRSPRSISDPTWNLGVSTTNDLR
jgi:hypothetical protein